MPDDVETGKQPSLRRGVSKTGRMAEFGDANAEVDRICANERNFYFVLRVKKDTPKAEVKANYYKLSRLVHPDKCSHPKAGDAAAVLNQAWDTLNNPIKKRAYDAYGKLVDDINVDAPEGMTYAEWEASNATQQVQIPAWLQKVLRLPGGAIIVALILFPLTLILLAFILVLAIICIPIQAVCHCLGCAPPPPPPGATAPGADDATKGAGGMTQEELMAEMAARNAEARKAAGQAPAHQPPMGA